MSELDGKLRVMLVDDHALVRSAVRQALTAPDVEFVGEAANAQEAMALAPVLRPDVLLLDIDLPGMNGIQLVQELAPRLPQTKIVMLTVSGAERDMLEAVARGAPGCRTCAALLCRCGAPRTGRVRRGGRADGPQPSRKRRSGHARRRPDRSR